MKMMNIKEGKISVKAPSGKKYDAPVFYNEDAEFTRDISVAVLSVFQKRFNKKMKILDALSATGISGIRYAKEVKNVSVTLNDKNPEAVKLIKKNAEKNKVKVKILNKDANWIMRKNLYDFIDIDPFGTPAPFLDSTAHSVKFNRLAAITATDQGALCGSFPNACLRKYGIRATKKPYYREVGVRVLITFIMNSFARYDKTFQPVLCLSHKHYYRIYGLVGGSTNMSKQLKNYKFVDGIGTIYMGKIKDNDFIKEVIAEIANRDFKKKSEEIRALQKILEEVDVPFYYEINDFCSKHKIPTPKLDFIIDKLKKKGFKASRTYFCLTGIKTNAKEKDILKII